MAGLRYRAFDQITAEDLRVLIRNKVFEKTNLECKRNLPGKTDRYRKEYLKDASSFANASGGHLIFGIEEKNGIPVDFPPLHESIIDGEIVRLHEMIDTGVRPRIHSLEIREVRLSADEYVIIARIPRSYNKPHMVAFNKSSRFYSRSSKGAFQMDIDQIRAATLSSRDIVDRIRLFRKSSRTCRTDLNESGTEHQSRTLMPRIVQVSGNGFSW